tara:strand:- start:1604 stop:1861 length:258 start_codon:yes stop_codon:yes gene_type:complete
MDDIHMFATKDMCGKVVWHTTPRGRYELSIVRQIISKKRKAHEQEQIVWRERPKRWDIGPWSEHSGSYRAEANKRTRELVLTQIF